MIAYSENIKVFTGNSNPEFAKTICKELGIELGRADVKHFADGEASVSLTETVRGADVFLVQSTCKPVNDNLMELLVMIDACSRASAGRITAVIPYFGYARQDRKAKSRDPISSKLVANMLTAAGADRILTMDLHADQIQGFFDIPLDHLRGAPSFVEYYMNKFPEAVFDHENDFVVVSPDVGSVARARNFAQKVHMNLAIVDKRRPKANVSEVMNIIGDATHGVLSGPAYERLENSVLKEMLFLNTIPEVGNTPSGKIKFLDVAPVFARAIEHIHGATSIADLF